MKSNVKKVLKVTIAISGVALISFLTGEKMGIKKTFRFFGEISEEAGVKDEIRKVLINKMTT